MKNKEMIYLLDDCESTTFIIQSWLEDKFDVKVFHSPLEFLENFKTLRPDLCILDVHLNDNRNGLDVLKEIQLSAKVHLPFIFISTEIQQFRKRYAYQLGAVDFIQKPLDRDELRHKISNIFKLMTPKSKNENDLIKLDEDNLCFTLMETAGNKNVKLTPKEFIIFKQLLKNKDAIVTREQILSRLESSLNETLVADRVIDVHICNIKKKLGPYKRVINSIYGVGYKYDTSKLTA